MKGAGTYRWHRVALAVALFLAFGMAAPASAQESGIAVTTLEVTSEFPKGFRFRIEAESPTPITKATLRFTVVGQRVARYQPLGITPGAHVQADFLVRTDTYERYLPPGSDIQYSVELQAEGGSAMATQPRLFTYLDPRFEWEEHQGETASVLSYGGKEALAQTVLQTVTLTLEDMQPLLGVTLDRPLRLVLYNTWSDMAGALPLASEVLRQQLVTEGQAHALEGIVLLLAEATSVVGVASHEVTHVLMYLAADNQLHPTPIWLDEGMAEYGNRAPTATFDRALSTAIAQGRLIPLRLLTTRPGRAEDIILMYGQGKSFVAFLVDTHGGEKLRRMLALFKGGQSLDDALIGAYGVGLDDLENQWRRSLGVSPLPTPGPTQALPSPAPIPTLPPLTLFTPAPEGTPPSILAASPTPAAGGQAPTPEGPPSGSGGLSCGISPGGTGPVDLSLALAALGMVALAVQARRDRGRNEGD